MAEDWVFAIDPGTDVSSWVWYGGDEQFPRYTGPYVKVVGRDEDNDEVLHRLAQLPTNDLSKRICVVCEDFEPMGQTVGIESIKTIRWTGRFQQQADRLALDFHFVKRTDVKLHLCQSRRAKDPNIHRVLLDKFGPSLKEAKGTPNFPGPVRGVASHAWSALAVAVTWWDANHRVPQAVQTGG